jgi:G8 domain/Ricin-type beta-trefoil lectin domain-like/HYR domain/Secretion system C-terminal sorting domain
MSKLLHHTFWGIFSCLLLTFTPALAQMNMPTQKAKIYALSRAILPNGDFEAPALAAGAFQYNAATPNWTLTGSAAIASNSSGFTSLNPNAPQGNQVLVIQGQSTANTNMNVAKAGFYRLTMQAAQRLNNRQTVHVFINDTHIGSVTPDNGNYTPHFSVPIFLPIGTHNIALRGISASDNSVFLDDINVEQLRTWNDATTWESGTVPMNCCMVTIPVGAAIVMDGECNSNMISIEGLLTSAVKTSFTTSAEGIFVAGASANLEVGQAAVPYQAKGTFILRGNNPAANLMNMNMGSKLIGAMNNGTINLHGIRKQSWTQLGATAAAGAGQITLKEAMNWSIGDEIVISSTDFDVHQAEVRTITAISGDSKTFTLNAALTNMHFGILQNYNNVTRQYELDERAEVGLLSHNLEVRGDDDSEANGFGGHIMSMVTGKSYLSNVRLFRMGQKSKLGRYPFHWHEAGSVAGQYVKNCAIYRSFNRAITVHSSNDALLEENVAYDHIGHGYFLEDGDEINNTFRRNLGILTRRPKNGEEVTPHDILDDNAGIQKFPATFWITNPQNNFEGNVCGGSEGSGFWMVVLSKPIGLPNSTMTPGRLPMGKFDDNKSHSVSFSNLAIDEGIDPVTKKIVGGHYSPHNAAGQYVTPVFNRFTSYKCRDRSIWMRGDHMDFRECRLADNGKHTFFAYNQVIYNSLLVGKSANIGKITSASEQEAGRSLPISTEPTTNWYNTFRGHSVYDGSSGIVDCHFAGYDGNNSFCFQTNGAAQKSTAHFLSGVSFDAAIPTKNKVDFTPASAADYMYSSGLIDRDGSLTGTAGSRLLPIIDKKYVNALDFRVYDEGFNNEVGSTRKLEWGAYVAPPNTTYGLMIFGGGWSDYPNNSARAIYAIRSDGFATYSNVGSFQHSQHPVIMNKNYEYYFQYHQIPKSLNLDLRFVNTNDKIVVALPNMPSAAKVVSGATLATSLADVRSSTTQKYFFKDNTFYFKIIGSPLGQGWIDQFGPEFSSGSSGIRICQDGTCSDPSGRLYYAMLADYETGNDSRGWVSALPGLAMSAIAADGNANTGSDATDNKIAWSITTDGDGIDEYADYHLNLSANRQIWTEYKTMGIKFTGPNIRVYVHDKKKGYSDLGTYSSADAANIKLSLNEANAEYLSDIDDVIIRVQESSIGSLTQKLTATVNLFEIRLNDIIPNGSYSTSLTLSDFANTDGDELWDKGEVALGRNPNSASDMCFNFSNNTQGWALGGTVVAECPGCDGRWWMRSEGNDPAVQRGGFNFKGDEVPTIVADIFAEAAGTFQLFWSTAAEPNLSEDKSVTIAYPTGSVRQTLNFMLANHPKWKGQTIKFLRLDPPGANGHTGIYSICAKVLQPIGNVDAVCSTVAGWAFDPCNAATSIDVHIYVRDAATNAVLGVHAVKADIARPDVNTAYNITGNHGFTYNLNALYCGKNVKIDVYGINLGCTNNNPLLGGSGKNCTLEGRPIFAGCPANQTLTTVGTTATATWAAPTATGSCGTPTITSTHNSGTAFPIGTTTVTYSAKDAKNNTITCSFTITVTKINSFATNKCYNITSRHSNLKMDVQNAVYYNNAAMVQNKANNSLFQIWRIHPLTAGDYRITNGATAASLSIRYNSNSNANGTGIVQNTWTNIDAQKWKLNLNSEGYYTITNKYANKNIDISGTLKTATNTPLVQQTANTTYAQQWKISETTCPLGVRTEAEAEQPSAFQLYPNPSIGIFYIALRDDFAINDELLHINMYNTLGQLIHQQKVNHTVGSPILLDVQGLPTGIYMVQVQNTKGIVLTKPLVMLSE